MEREKLVSPCISICQIDPVSGNCSGCYRTRGEIARWRDMDYDEQAALLSQLNERRQALTGVTKRKNRRRT